VTVGLGIGVGALEVLQGGRSGQVVAAFRQAAYVRFPAGIIALTTTAVPSGPIYLRGAVRLCRLQKGERVVVGSEALRLPVWRGALPTGPCDTSALRSVAAGSALLQSPLRARADAAHRAVAGGDLGEAAALLGGLGPGLTPSGDDALAGILLAARIRWTIAAEPYLVAIANQVNTHSISRQFLVWAARGQSIEPVHDVLMGVSAVALSAYGHTSGADLALGLVWGLADLPEVRRVDAEGREIATSGR
jgi:hypothetical protein